jgi:hypothetical protein
MVAMMDGVLSSLLTCHPAGNQANQSVDSEDYQKCTALAGPVLISLTAIVDFIDTHGDVFVAAFTAVLAVFTARLWVSTEKLWTATKDTAERQERDTRTLQRAYLSVEPGGIHPFPDGTHRMSCDLIIKNAGSLPARTSIIFTDREDSHKRYFVPPRYEEETVEIVIAPHGEARLGARHVPFDIFEKWWATSQPRPDHWLYVWGRIRYHDGFAKGRWLDFCHRYHLGGAARGGLKYEIPAMNGRHHERGNRTDESEG